MDEAPAFPTRSQLNTIMITGLCAQHAEESAAWLDYRITPGIRIGAGASRDDTVAGVRDRQRMRFEDWRSTITFQQDLIRRICAVRCTAGRIVTVPVNWESESWTR